MMTRVRLLLPCCFLAVTCVAQTLVSTPPSAAPPGYPSTGALADKIAGIVTAPAVSRAHWGVAVSAMDGTPLYGFNEGQFFRPASNAKLFTTAAAMALLGPDKTFTTQIFGQLDSATGTLEGDLVLFGGGDPSFGSNDLPYITPALRPKVPPPAPLALNDLREMVDQLVAKGVKHIIGRIVGDDTLFPYEPYPGSWDQGDAVWGYGAPISALTIADNEMLLTIPPGTITGAPGHQTFRNSIPVLDQNGVKYYSVKSEVSVYAAGGSHVDVDRAPGSRMLRAYGGMPVDAAPDTEQVAIDDPALYAAMALRKLLIERGITIDGTEPAHPDMTLQTVGADSSAVALHQPVRFPRSAVAALEANSPENQVMAGGGGGGSCMTRLQPGAVLASHTSAPLGSDVLFTNKVSQNLHAEIFLHQLGRVIFCGQGSDAEGTRMVRAFLTHAGLDANDFLFYDGSGLSSHDLVTPRATAKLLSYASTQPWFAQWKASLPTGGEDGTLRSRFGEKSGLKDHVFAKTGTLGESRALSGYVDAASGKTVIFSVFVDTHTPTTSADREAMDAIVVAIAAAN